MDEPPSVELRIEFLRRAREYQEDQKPLPDDLKSLAVRYARQLAVENSLVERAAAEMGVSHDELDRWMIVERPKRDAMGMLRDFIQDELQKHWMCDRTAPPWLQDLVVLYARHADMPVFEAARAFRIGDAVLRSWWMDGGDREAEAIKKDLW